MLAREERGRLNTALLQPMAIYEATGTKVLRGIPFSVASATSSSQTFEVHLPSWRRGADGELLSAWGEELVSQPTRLRAWLSRPGSARAKATGSSRSPSLTTSRTGPRVESEPVASLRFEEPKLRQLRL